MASAEWGPCTNSFLTWKYENCFTLKSVLAPGLAVSNAKKKEIIKNLQENKLPGNSRLCPLVWAFVPRASVVSTRALGTHASIICFIASALRFDYTGQPPCSWALSDTSQHLILQGRQRNPFLPTAAFCCGQWWFMNTPLCCSIGALLCSWKTCVCPNTDIRVSCSLKNNLIMHQGHFSELVI